MKRVADLHNVELIAADNAPGLRIMIIFPQSAALV